MGFQPSVPVIVLLLQAIVNLTAGRLCRIGRTQADFIQALLDYGMVRGAIFER
jgi:hypothetical protein